MVTSIRRAAAILCLSATACASPAAAPIVSPQPTATFVPASPSPSPAATRAPLPTPTPAVATTCTAGPGEVALVIDGKANLFAAGSETPADPGGGGAGRLPPVIELPAGSARVLTVPCTDGQVNCCYGAPDGLAPPGGTDVFATDIESHGGISGIVVGDRSIFLAGVFLTDTPAEPPAPERLDQTGTTRFRAFEPAIAQTFVIGTGEGSSWVVPSEATRLYLGIMDAYLTTGPHGWYGNNSGWFEATVRVSGE